MINNISSLNKADIKRFEHDRIIVRQGQQISRMYFILQGNVGLYENYMQNCEQKLDTLQSGQFIGVRSLFLDAPQQTTAVAENEVLLLKIDRENVFEFIQSQPETGFILIKNLCLRLNKAELQNERFDRQLRVLNAALQRDKAKPEQPALAEASAANTNGDSLNVPNSHPANALVEASIDTLAPLRPNSLKNKPLPPSAAFNLATKAEPPAEDNTDQAYKIDDNQPYGALFPDGHGNYYLPLPNNNQEYLFEKTISCPQCKKALPILAIKKSKLHELKTDTSLRIYYKDIEPAYYEVVTCPHCWFSAFTDAFSNVNRVVPEHLAKALAAYKGNFSLPLFDKRDALSVFGGYYLALIAAEICFGNQQLIQGKLWLKLSRIYEDCRDFKMAEFALQKALENYEYTYQNISIPAQQNQQLSYILGDLYYRKGNRKKAYDYFYQARMDKMGSAVFKRRAENRIEEIRKQMRKED